MLSSGVPLGGYEILGLLGRGGMGAVYRAKDPRSGREVAVKLISGEITPDAPTLERFEREAELAKKVHHPNVVACLGAGSEGGRPWIAFELVTGGNLKELVKARGRLPWREAARLGAQVARGLAAIHAAGLVHRDVKPANVLLDGAGRAKVADLGLARGELSAKLTRTGETVGTYEYMAPEQLETSKVDRRADLYALGCSLYELLTGRVPFEGQGFALVQKHITQAPTPPRELARDLPPELDALVRRLLAKRPEDRGDSAIALAGELEELAAMRTRRPLAAILFAALALALVALLPFLRREPRPTAPPKEPSVAPVRSSSWFDRLQGRLRPARLPFGVVPVLESEGDYRNEKDGSLLRFVPAGTVDLIVVRGKVQVAAVYTVEARPVEPFFIGKFEVSNAQWKRFLAAGGKPLSPDLVGYPTTHHRDDDLSPNDTAFEGSPDQGASWEHPLGAGSTCEDDHPVVCISCADAAAYATWAGLALPTETQWQHAASFDPESESHSLYPWGMGDPGPEILANLADESFFARFSAIPGFKAQHLLGVDDHYPTTSPCGAFPRDVTRTGAFDMGGNVREWCADVRPYRILERETHATRGGSWAHMPEYSKCNKLMDNSLPADFLGFRVAVAVPAR